MLWHETLLEPVQEHGFGLCSRNTSGRAQEHPATTLFSTSFAARKQPLSMNKLGHHPQHHRLSLPATRAAGPACALQSP